MNGLENGARSGGGASLGHGDYPARDLGGSPCLYPGDRFDVRPSSVSGAFFLGPVEVTLICSYLTSFPGLVTSIRTPDFQLR